MKMETRMPHLSLVLVLLLRVAGVAQTFTVSRITGVINCEKSVPESLRVLNGFTASLPRKHRIRWTLCSAGTTPNVEDLKSSLLRDIASYSRDNGNLDLKQRIFGLIQELEVSRPCANAPLVCER